jgi:hypothetical protein
MVSRATVLQNMVRAAAGGALLAIGVMLSGCAGMGDSVGDSMTAAFADPAKYVLWDCKQLEPERKRLAMRIAEVQALMAKAETGTAGPLVAEVAYRNEYLTVRGQAHFAEETWRKNNCHETPPAPAASPAKPAPKSKTGSAIH